MSSWNISKIRRQVINLAKELRDEYKPLHGSDWWKYAMRQAWKVIKLKWRLFISELVKFVFIKKDGSKRVANGTMKSKLVQPRIKGTSNRKRSADTIIYFDIDKGAFRSFKASKLVI